MTTIGTNTRRSLSEEESARLKRASAPSDITFQKLPGERRQEMVDAIVKPVAIAGGTYGLYRGVKRMFKGKKGEAVEEVVEGKPTPARPTIPLASAPPPVEPAVGQSTEAARKQVSFDETKKQMDELIKRNKRKNLQEKLAETGRPTIETAPVEPTPVAPVEAATEATTEAGSIKETEAKLKELKAELRAQKAADKKAQKAAPKAAPAAATPTAAPAVERPSISFTPPTLEADASGELSVAERKAVLKIGAGASQSEAGMMAGLTRSEVEAALEKASTPPKAPTAPVEAAPAARPSVAFTEPTAGEPVKATEPEKSVKAKGGKKRPKLPKDASLYAEGSPEQIIDRSIRSGAYDSKYEQNRTRATKETKKILKGTEQREKTRLTARRLRGAFTQEGVRRQTIVELHETEAAQGAQLRGKTEYMPAVGATRAGLPGDHNLEAARKHRLDTITAKKVSTAPIGGAAGSGKKGASPITTGPLPQGTAIGRENTVRAAEVCPR